ncbi:hypothetical protein CDL12_22975 [Handroanthus impetiginosus]|uniref:Uncharacterized protein n=1 Tax=Handroanthus impetiginosus TaxID=429701 RepID=A0A2G9GHJ5_9LAMI|nr:hypothetical protein CDL12_22975 [Handroanthus impetiginosus]
MLFDWSSLISSVATSFKDGISLSFPTCFSCSFSEQSTWINASSFTKVSSTFFSFSNKSAFVEFSSTDLASYIIADSSLLMLHVKASSKDGFCKPSSSIGFADKLCSSREQVVSISSPAAAPFQSGVLSIFSSLFLRYSSPILASSIIVDSSLASSGETSFNDVFSISFSKYASFSICELSTRINEFSSLFSFETIAPRFCKKISSSTLLSSKKENVNLVQDLFSFSVASTVSSSVFLSRTKSDALTSSEVTHKESFGFSNLASIFNNVVSVLFSFSHDSASLSSSSSIRASCITGDLSSMASLAKGKCEDVSSLSFPKSSTFFIFEPSTLIIEFSSIEIVEKF